MNVGEVQLILGPMFSGKTSELIRKYSRYVIAEKKCVMVKYGKDTRFSLTDVVTHDGVKISALTCDTLANLDFPADTNVICIDEIQFYDDAVEFVKKTSSRGITIVAAGLNGTYKQEEFKTVSQLLPLATDLVFCKSICHTCKRDGATFSKRISADIGDVVIGGADKYEAACNNCKLGIPRSE